MNFRHLKFSLTSEQHASQQTVNEPSNSTWRAPIFGAFAAVAGGRAHKISRALLVGASLVGALGGPQLAHPGASRVAMAASAPLSKPAVVGNPFTGKRAIYARNVWDMQSFGGKIYLGHGDSAANSGNTPIFSLDAKTDQFTNEYLTRSEQVDEFFPMGGSLYVMDHDPTGSNIGNLYATSGNGSWGTRGQIDGTAHMYGLAQFEGEMVVAGGSISSSAWRGSGRSWREAVTGDWRLRFGSYVLNRSGRRTWMLLPVGGSLYAVQDWWQGVIPADVGFLKVGKNGGENIGVTVDTLYGGLSQSSQPVRYKRLVTLDDGSALTLLAECVNDHQWNPRALMWVRSFKPGGVAALALPGGARPYDIIRRGDTVYVCAWDAAHKQVAVFALSANNPKAGATEILRFAAPTFARSFEEAGGSFYFGLGCDVSPVPEETGQIWKVAASKSSITLPNTSPSSPTPAPMPTATPTPTATATPKPTPAPTATPKPTPTATPKPTATPQTSGTPVPTPIVEPDPEPEGLTSGLLGSYYEGMELKGEAVAQRVESEVSLSASSDVAVLPQLGSTKWSARYEGMIEAPISGAVELWTLSDDGVRVWVDGKKIIDNWTAHGPQWDGATIEMGRGQRLPIRIEYFQNTGGTKLQLHWEWDIQNRVLVPAGKLSHRP